MLRVLGFRYTGEATERLASHSRCALDEHLTFEVQTPYPVRFSSLVVRFPRAGRIRAHSYPVRACAACGLLHSSAPPSSLSRFLLLQDIQSNFWLFGLVLLLLLACRSFPSLFFDDNEL